MRLVSLKMRGSVEINYIFGLIWRRYGPKQDILDYWGTIIFFLNPIISYLRIKFYRVETMDMRTFPLTPFFQWDITISIVSTL